MSIVGSLGLASPGTTTSVQVWDDTVPADTLATLHRCCTQRGLGHNVLLRRTEDRKGDHNEVERAVDALLTALDDDAPVVEYWSRQDWRHIEAHADVDERASRSGAPLRYPDRGHVLYLQVGTAVRGPTCLFSDCRSGADLSETEDTVTLVTVPAVAGRLLRFPGDALHAVPRPSDKWLRAFVVGAPQTDPADDWGRSVVLFNTWREAPEDVAECDQESTNENRVTTTPREEWREVPIAEQHDITDHDDDDDVVNAKVWLLGDEARRGIAGRTVKMRASEARLREALEEPLTVRATLLHGTSP